MTSAKCSAACKPKKKKSNAFNDDKATMKEILRIFETYDSRIRRSDSSLILSFFSTKKLLCLEKILKKSQA